MKLLILSVILISCLVNLTTARYYGPPQSQSKARRVKHLGEWFAKIMNNPVPVTKNENKLRSTFGRSSNTAPIGSKWNPNVRLAPIPYIKKSKKKDEKVMGVMEYLHKRRHDPRPIAKSGNFPSVLNVPTGA